MMVTINQIEDLGQKIGAQFNPDRVILFGSYAEGKPTENSDVDLLVIMPYQGSSVDQSVEIRLTVRPPFSVDLLVRSPAKIQERLLLGDPFIRRILEKGKSLYEAPQR